MKLTDHDSEHNITGMIIGPLYFGMLVNIALPAALLFLCWYLNNHYSLTNRIPELANTLFYVFAALSVAQAALALWWRHRSFNQPMVRRAENFEADITQALMKRFRPVSLLIAAMSIWGYIYFYLTARFQETAVFVVLSFIVFQVIRPRYGSVKRLIEWQQKLVSDGKFLRDGLSLHRDEP